MDIDGQKVEAKASSTTAHGKLTKKDQRFKLQTCNWARNTLQCRSFAEHTQDTKLSV